MVATNHHTRYCRSSIPRHHAFFIAIMVSICMNRAHGWRNSFEKRQEGDRRSTNVRQLAFPSRARDKLIAEAISREAEQPRRSLPVLQDNALKAITSRVATRTNIAECLPKMEHGLPSYKVRAKRAFANKQ